MDTGKLRDYCLSLDHPRGRHKANVFAATLGLTQEDAGELQEELLSAARVGNARTDKEDQYGQRYVLDFEMSREGGSARIRSAWIVRRDEDFPRLTSCYVL